MAVITFTDAIGAATLRNAFPGAGGRFANWHPITRPFGDSVNKMADGGLVFFKLRDDYGASFELPGLPVKILDAPTGVVATPSNAGGSLPAGTHYYFVTAILPHGESTESAEVSAVTTGATGSVALTWNPVANATSYHVYRGTASFMENVSYTGIGLGYTDTGAAGGVGSPTLGGTNVVAIADRLIAWLLAGGTCSVATEDVQSHTYATCGLYPGSTPSLRLTDRQHLEYTLSLQLLNLAGSPARMDCVYV